MDVEIFTHADMSRHRPGPGHPDAPARLATVLAALREADLDGALRAAPLAERDDLARVHLPGHLERLLGAEPAEGEPNRSLDADTHLSPGSVTAALRAAGATTEAVRRVAAGETSRAFCAVRPPGHHAEPGRAMGFCLFSTVAVAARAAQAAGLAKVAVIDFDVHHGNGTQSVVETDPTLFLGSIHQWPLFPGTGAPSERGVGNVVNATVAPDAARETWRGAFTERLMPALDAFAPDLILISAGFDAHARDPLAHQRLEAEDFAWATRAILEVARSRARGRVVSSLEGGYDLRGLAESTVAHVRALQGD